MAIHFFSVQLPPPLNVSVINAIIHCIASTATADKSENKSPDRRLQSAGMTPAVFILKTIRRGKQAFEGQTRHFEQNCRLRLKIGIISISYSKTI
ncbi:MAG: hypothetical protein NT145_07680 [Elusimicrobia bacterium]|nr:hypothetical protein [Elusimicrobiota bacterium]